MNHHSHMQEIPIIITCEEILLKLISREATTSGNSGHWQALYLLMP